MKANKPGRPKRDKLRTQVISLRKARYSYAEIADMVEGINSRQMARYYEVYPQSLLDKEIGKE